MPLTPIEVRKAQDYLRRLANTPPATSQLLQAEIQAQRFAARPVLARGLTQVTQGTIQMVNTEWRQIVPGDTTRRMFVINPNDNDLFIWPLAPGPVTTGGLKVLMQTPFVCSVEIWGFFAQQPWFCITTGQPVMDVGLFTESYLK